MHNCMFCLDTHLTAQSLLRKATHVAMGSAAHTDTGDSSGLPARSVVSSSLGELFSPHGEMPISALSKMIVSFNGQDDHLALWTHGHAPLFLTHPQQA